jgi:RNA polymerase sigma-70 factor (ECF subfamily)
MLAVRDGDMAAFAQLVLRYQAEAWRVAYRFTGDAAEAEDLAQEAFLRILQAADRYKPTASFRTYLFAVLTRLCLDHARKKRPALADLQSQVADLKQSPWKRISQKDRAQAVEAALKSLAPNQRMAAVLRYYENMNYREIASAMNTSVKAVERLLARGREALEPMLSPWLEE